MSSLNMSEKKVLEKLFKGHESGYVLDFNNPTFADFFSEYNVNIDNKKYHIIGTSKMNRLRAFWKIESDELVGKTLKGLLKYALIDKLIPIDDESYITQGHKIIARLQGKNISQDEIFTPEQEFIHQEFSEIDWVKLNIDGPLEKILQQRIKEVHITLKENAPLSAIFLCGSILEGLLLSVACKDAQKFKGANSAPKSKEVHEWTLDQLINAACDVKLLRLDVKQHSHSLRGFRNYIHPHRQVSENFNPTKRTAEISWKVVQAVIEDLSEHKGV